MMRLGGGLSIAGVVLSLVTLPACERAAGEKGRSSDSPVREDVKQVARATEKTAKDIGRAAVEAGNKVGADSKDAWITTKVKSELASKGFDPLRVYVDTDGRVVTLSGTVESAAEREKAVALARGVKDVAGVTDHLFVAPARK